MKSRVVAVLLLSFFSFLLVYLLKFKSDRATHHKNGFNRTLARTLIKVRELELPNNGLYFIGHANKEIFLGHPQTPFEIVRLSEGAEKYSHVKIIHTQAVHSAKIYIDSPYFYLADLNRYTIHRGLLRNWSITKKVYNKPLFSEFIPISNSSIILRSIVNKEFELVRADQASLSRLNNVELLQKQVDGLFCVDGILQYNRNLKKLIYVYFYRNQFVVMDSSLNLEYRATTIDTISRASIKVALIESSNAFAMSSPPLVVNRRSLTADSVLYVNSEIPADNDMLPLVNRSSVIDMYKLKDGVYLGSFSLPPYDGIKMGHFYILDDKLYSLHGKHIITYKIRPASP